MSDFNNLDKCFKQIKKDIQKNIPDMINHLSDRFESQCNFDIKRRVKSKDPYKVVLSASTDDKLKAQEIDKKFKELSKLTESRIEQLIDT